MNSSFQGAAKRITGQQLANIGASIGVGENELRAFMSVESAGSGFDKQGRPKMLFEPHIFYRNLSGNQRKAAVSQGLAYAKWGEKKYPADSYPRLKAAMKINVDAAIKSASWGLFQNLGSYYKDVGYSTPLDMVEAFSESEGSQVEAAADLIVKWGIADDLAAHRWANVAKVWNGSGYKKNKYDTKLAAAYERLSKAKPVGIADIQQPAPVTPPPPAPTKEIIQAAQKRLLDLGYPPGGIDGKLGPLTQSAIRDFRSDNGLPLGGTIDEEFLSALAVAQPRKLAPERTNASAAEVTAKVPEANAHWWNKWLAGGGGGTVGLAALFDALAPAKGYAETVRETIGDVPTPVWIGICSAILLGVAYMAYRGQKASEAAFKTGERL